MLKKFVSSVLAVLLLTACNSKTVATKSVDDLEKSVTSLVSDLNLTNKLEKVEDGIVNGLFSFADGVVAESSVYIANDKTADTVAIFIPKDIKQCKDAITDYLQQQKVQAQNYYPDEVFKIDNAILEDNGTEVILVICADMEVAKQKVSELLSQ